jgi:DNA-binding beta-propeller fold protein YncE
MRNFALRARGFSLALALPCLSGLWAASASAQSVVATIPMPNPPGTMAINPATGYVFVPIAGTGQVDVIKESNQQIVHTISIGEDAAHTAVNIKTARLYVADPYVGALYVFDSNSYALLATVSISDASWVAVNEATNTVYVSDFGNTIYVVSGATNTITTTITTNSAQQIAVNPRTNTIYDAPGNPFEGQLIVIDGNTNQVTTTIDIPNSNSTQYVAVDPLRNLVYAVDLVDDTTADSGDLVVINGTTNAVVTSVTIAGEPTTAAVDPVRRMVYVSNTSLGEIQVFNAATNQLTSTTVPTGASPDETSLDIYHGLLYVGNAGDEGDQVPNPTGPSITVISTNAH